MKHKRPKKPTRAQEETSENAGYRREDWLERHPDSIALTIVHKKTGQRRVILC